jgi:hypothetical protein
MAKAAHTSTTTPSANATYRVRAHLPTPSISDMVRRYDEINKIGAELDRLGRYDDPRYSEICDEMQDLEYQIVASPSKVDTDVAAKQRFADIVIAEGGLRHLVDMIMQIDADRVAVR